jgi:RNA polymerase sigma-70 factor (ECF subfamily)
VEKLALAHDLSTLSDETLVECVLERDEMAVREIVRRYNQRLFRAARAILRNDAEAEDVVQAGYVRAFTSLKSFRAESQFATWLTRIVMNEALGRLRRRKPTTDLDQIEREQPTSAQIIQFPFLQTPSDPETAMSRQETRALLEHAVDTLPEDFRVVFVLRDVEGLSIEETATQLMIKPETVNTRLFRARRLLRSEIENRLALSFGALFPFDGLRCAHMAERVLEELRTAAPLF